MILDYQLMFADAQAVTASAASTNIVDLTAAGDILEDLNLVVRCDTTATSANGTATVTAKLQTATDSAFTTPVDLYVSPAFTISQLNANTNLVKTCVPCTGVLRYLRVYFTVGTQNLTAGKFDAFLTPQIETNLANAT